MQRDGPGQLARGSGAARAAARFSPWSMLLAALTTCMVLFGCGQGATVKLGASDDGKTVTAHVGDHVMITLDENPTTGYVWAVDTNDDSVLALTSSDYTGSGVPLAGAGGTRTFTFAVEQAGTADLALKQWRPWEGDKSIVGRYHVTIQAQGS